MVELKLMLLPFMCMLKNKYKTWKTILFFLKIYFGRKSGSLISWSISCCFAFELQRTSTAKNIADMFFSMSILLVSIVLIINQRDYIEECTCSYGPDYILKTNSQKKDRWEGGGQEKGCTLIYDIFKIYIVLGQIRPRKVKCKPGSNITWNRNNVTLWCLPTLPNS